MSVKIRLARYGTKKKPFYRIVVADNEAPRDGKFIEKIGTYDPNTDPSTVVVDTDRASEWIKKGAIPSNTVGKLLKIAEKEA